jgi:hypothetical protein
MTSLFSHLENNRLANYPTFFHQVFLQFPRLIDVLTLCDRRHVDSRLDRFITFLIANSSFTPIPAHTFSPSIIVSPTSFWLSVMRALIKSVFRQLDQYGIAPRHTTRDHRYDHYASSRPGRTSHRSTISRQDTVSYGKWRRAAVSVFQR